MSRSASKSKASERAAKARSTVKPDPIFAAIDLYRKADRTHRRACDASDVARLAAQKVHGERPWRLIAWREYTAIGGSEIEKARDEFLRDEVASADTIQREYREAKQRARAAKRAGHEWDKRAGVAALQAETDRAWAAYWRAVAQLAKTRPTTPAGASKMVALLAQQIDWGDAEWHVPALKTVAKALADMNGRAQ